MPDPTSDSPSSSEPIRDYEYSRKGKRCERIFWISALALGLLQAWGRRHESGDGLAYMGADGISYLDIGDAYLRGDWYVALNGMWSPCYSWIVGFVLRLLKPSAFWEFTVVRLLNFLIFIFALCTFTYFLRALRRDHTNQLTDYALPEASWLFFGYTLFIWTSLFLNHVSRTSPDLLLAALVFLASGLLLRIRVAGFRWSLFVALGVVLGIGYLTKTIMFPLAFVFIAVAFFLVQRTIGVKAAVLRSLVSLILFLTLALPLVIVLSRIKHRFTIGESARVNYAWYVNGTTRFIHWQGEPPGSGTPAHATRKVFERPAIYEFGGSPGVSYPPWYDPSYWYEGVTPHFNLRQQVAAIYRNLGILYALFLYRFFLVTIAVLLFLLLYQSGAWRLVYENIRHYWFLLVPSLIAGGSYLAINIEPRYLAPFVPVIALAVLAGVRLPQTVDSKRLTAAINLAVLLVFIVSLVPFTGKALYSTVQEVAAGSAASRDVEWQVADGLRKLGIQPNERVAVIGNPMFASWPRLARVRVVAEMPEMSQGNTDLFWSADEKTKQQALAAFAATGARVLIAEKIPAWAESDLASGSSCWRQIAQTDHYVCFLHE